MRHPSLSAALVVAPLLLHTATAFGQTPSPTTQSSPPPESPVAEQASGTVGSDDDLTKLSLEDLMNVEVTSVSRKKQSIFEAPAAVSVITQDDIRRSGFSTIPDMLRLAPGVNVGRANSYAWGVGVRGLNSQFNGNLLVLQDGRSLYNSLFGGVFWDTVDYVTPDIERIEVIRGPGATLWGANAVNGVINITTKDAKDTQGWLLDQRISNDDSYFSARYGAKLDADTYYRAYLKTKYDDEFRDETGDSLGDNWYGLRGGFRIDRHLTNDTLTISGEVNNNNINQPYNYPAGAPPFVDQQLVDRNDTAGHLLARLNHRVDNNSDWTLQVYYDFLKVKFFESNYEQSTGDIDFHHHFRTGERNEVTWGLGYRLIHSDIHDSPLLNASPSIKNDSLISAFVQDTYAVVPDKWFFTLGTKLEHNDYTGFEVQPSARLMWTPNKQNTVWTAVSYAVHTPNRVGADLTANLGTTQIPVAPGQTVPATLQLQNNPDLESEELTAYEVGYRVEPVTGFSIDTSLFYNNYKNLQSFAVGAPQVGPSIVVPIVSGNEVSASTWGGEISSTLQVTRDWRLTGSYSLLEVTTVDPTGGSGMNTDGNSAPQHQAQLHSYWNIARNMELNAGVFYVGEVQAYDVPGYISSDINFVWRPKEGMTFTLGVMNLFDHQHQEFDVSGNQGIGGEVPRTVYAQLTYQF
jgi:iron complex outermembrane receptor protein